MRRKYFSHSKGFTLVEAVAAMIILGFTVVSLLMLFRVTLSGSVENNSAAVATNLAEDKLEEITNNKYTSGYSSVTTGTTTDTVTVNGIAYTRTTVVSYVDPSTLATSVSDQGIKQVTITVTAGGKTWANLTSLISDYYF